MHARVDSLHQLGRHSEAESVARQHLSEAPDDAFMKVLLARALFRQDKIGPASDVINAAIALNPDLAFAYRMKGIIHAATGFLSEADKAYTYGIGLAPHDPYMYLHRAYLDIGSYEAKPKRLRKLASKTKFSPDMTRAQSDLDEAVTLAPADANIHLGFAALYLVQDRKYDAQKAARRALEIDPQSAAAHEMLGQLAEDNNDLRAASEHYVAAGKSDPTDATPLARLRKLGTPALAAPGIVAFLVLRILTRTAQVNSAALILVVALVLAAIIGWLAYSQRKQAAARTMISEDARQILDADRSSRKSRFRR